MASEIIRMWMRDPLDDHPDDELPPQSTREEAQIRAATIRASLHRFQRDTEDAIVEAYRRRDWLTLGYPGWADYVRGEFGTDRLRLPADERAESAARFHVMGMSARSIASTLGVSRNTIAGDLAPAEPPETVLGADGKKYKQSQTAEDGGPGYVANPDERLAVAAELPGRETDWPEVAAPGGAVASATPGNATGEAPADQSPEVRYRAWRKFAAASLRKATKEIGVLTGDLLDAGTVAERADEALVTDLEKLAADLTAFCRQVRALRPQTSRPGQSGRDAQRRFAGAGSTGDEEST